MTGPTGDRQTGDRPITPGAARAAAQLPLPDLLDAVLEVGRGIELDATLQRIINVAVDVLGARYGALGVRAREARGQEASGQGGRLREFVHTGIEPERRAVMGALPTGHGVLGELIARPKVLRIERLSDHAASVGLPANHPPMSSFLGAPIMIGDNVFGSIYLTEKPDGFTAADEATVAVLAQAAAIAIGNASLFERARNQANWMSALARLSTRARTGSRLTDMWAHLLTEVAALTGARAAAIGVTSTGRPAVVATFPAALAIPAVVRVDRLEVRRATRAELAAAGLVDGWVTMQPLPHGYLWLLHRAEPEWDDEETSGLSAIADIAALAVDGDERRRVDRDLHLLAERHRIARDLHDVVIQRLFAVGLSLQATTSGRAEKVPERLRQSIVELDETVQEIRTAIFDLGGETNSASGLRRMILDQIAELAESVHPRPAVRFIGPVDTTVAPRLHRDAAAVVREGTANALRHARASLIAVTVAVDADTLTIEITDNGVGLPAAEVDPVRDDIATAPLASGTGPTGGTGQGMGNLRRRAVRHGGSLQVLSAATGTSLIWSVPLGD